MTEKIDLIQQLNALYSEFETVQNNALEVKANLERNQKMIEALENENAALVAEQEKVTISASGAVDFSNFDDKSDQIFRNNRKIEKLKEIISQYGVKFNYILSGDYKSLEKRISALKQKVQYIELNEKITAVKNDPEIMGKLSEIYSLFISSIERPAHTEFTDKERFYQYLERILPLEFNPVSINGLNEVKAMLFVPNYTIWDKNKINQQYATLFESKE